MEPTETEYLPYTISRIYLSNGLKPLEIYKKLTKDGEEIIVESITNDVHSHMLDLREGIGYYDAKKFIAVKKTIWDKRSVLIKEHHLEDHHLLMQVLLVSSPWGQLENKCEPLYVPASNEDIHLTLDKIIELFDLIYHEESYTIQNLEKTSEYQPEWFFKSASFNFKFKNGTVKDKIISFPEKTQGFLMFVLTDYLRILNGFGDTIEGRISGIRKYTPTHSSEPVKNPHYIFTYNFINFLDLHSDKNSLPEKSRRQQFILYDTFLKEAGYTINTISKSDRDKNIQQWYNTGKTQIAEYQRNNPDFLIS